MNRPRVQMAVDEVTNKVLSEQPDASYSDVRRIAKGEVSETMADLRTEAIRGLSEPERVQLIVDRLFELFQNLEGPPSFEGVPTDSCEASLWALFEQALVDRASETALGLLRHDAQEIVARVVNQARGRLEDDTYHGGVESAVTDSMNALRASGNPELRQAFTNPDIERWIKREAIRQARR